MGELALHVLRSERRSLAGWSLATVLLIGSVLAFWPSIGENPQMTSSFASLPPSVQAATGLGDLSSPAGYLQGQLFSTLLPLIFLSFAISRGARAIAGEEERGTMDLLLATPVRRSRIVAEKGMALMAEVVILALVSLAAMLAIAPIVDIDISAGRLAAATAGSAALGLFYGGLALAMSGATGRQGISLGVAAGLGAAGFLYTSIAPFVSSLSDHLGFSPFQHAYGYDPLRNGFDLGDTALLLGGALLFAALAVLLFNRRDVR